MNQKLKKKRRGPGSRLLAFALCCSLLCGMIPSVSADEMEQETLAMTELAAETMPETVETEPVTAASQEETVQEVTGAPETEAPATESAAAEAPGNSEYETSLPDTEPSTSYEEQTTAPDTTETVADSEQKSDVAADTEMPAEDATDAGDEKATEDEALTETASEEQTEAETEEKKPEFSYETALDGVTVTIHAEEGILPEGTTVTVKPLDDAVLEKAAESINDRLAEKEVVQIIGFDICFFDPDGNELHDLDDKVKVVYSGMDIAEEAEEAQVYHADEEGNITHTLTEAAAPSETVEFASDQFSPVLYATYNDGISTLASGSYTIAVGETITLTGSSGLNHSWSSNSSSVASVAGNRSECTVTGIAEGTAKITHQYYNYNNWGGQQTEEYTVTVTGSNGVEGAQVYYLLTPTSDPDSNEVDQWGPNVGTGHVNTTGATWINNKNVFTPSQYVVSWPDGTAHNGESWLMPRSGYENHYQAIFNAYKDKLEKELGVALENDDIEAIYLVPYKISKGNGTSPDKHIDCTISVKTNNVFAAVFWVTEPDGTVRQVDAKNYKTGDNVQKTTKPVEQTKVVDGVTYVFDGWYNEANWYNEAKEKVSEWPYEPNDAELSDGTVNFYAHYIPAVKDIVIEKQVTGSMGDFTKSFEFSYSYGDQSDTFTLTNGQTHTIKNVPINAELTLTEINAGDYEISAKYGETPMVVENGAMKVRILDTADRIVVTNHKDGVPDTGIILDSLPYVLILVIVVVGGVLFLRKRRNRYEN